MQGYGMDIRVYKSRQFRLCCLLFTIGSIESPVFLMSFSVLLISCDQRQTLEIGFCLHAFLIIISCQYCSTKSMSVWLNFRTLHSEYNYYYYYYQGMPVVTVFSTVQTVLIDLNRLYMQVQIQLESTVQINRLDSNLRI